MIIDEGGTDVGLESTIISCLTDPPSLLRPGGLSRAAAEQVLGKQLKDGVDDQGRTDASRPYHVRRRLYAEGGRRTGHIHIEPETTRSQLTRARSSRRKLRRMRLTTRFPIRYLSATCRCILPNVAGRRRVRKLLNFVVFLPSH